MTPKFTLVTAVAGVALLIAAVPAWGQDQLPTTYPDVVERATAAKIASESTTQLNLRAVLPSDSVESASGATERAFAPQPFNLRTVVASDSVENATGATERSGDQSFNLRHMLAADSVQMPRTGAAPTSIATSDSGSGLEWPQIGIGFGIGILLALGLVLTVRLTRVPPIAH
jgi:hypothetical protein